MQILLWIFPENFLQNNIDLELNFQNLKKFWEKSSPFNS